jgi:tRNA(His) 5'-end guanylyltransferase
MPVHDDLGIRMKTYYEGIPKTKLMRRTPVAIRLDGKAFHTFTRGFEKPFDEVLGVTMRETMKYLCENIQGCVLGYTQSDEITLILCDYKKLDTSAWFDYEVQKMCSISASMATLAFNKFFYENAYQVRPDNVRLPDPEEAEYKNTLYKAIEKGAMFDARVFNIPKEEVTNLIYWRQLDATRNSIQMVGQANFSHNELQYKSCNMIQDMLHEQRDINWNDFPTHLKRGSCCVKNVDLDEYGNDWGSGWYIDLDIPIFKSEGRDYIEKRIHFD